MSGSRVPWQRLLIEGMTAASELISEDIRADFLIIGGAALIQYGSNRFTRDIDIAITPQTLHAFEEKARKDPRFKLHSDGHWAYTAQGSEVEDLVVEFEFLAVGNEFVPKMRGMTRFDPIWVAWLADIAVMKARAYRDRDEPRDKEDLLYVLGEMKKTGQTLGQYGVEESEITVIRSALSEGVRNGLSQMMG
jgi:hypothetical protein